MALTHTTACRIGLAGTVAAMFGVSQLYLDLATDATFTTILATLTFSTPPFPLTTSATIVANAIAPDTDVAAGTCTAFRIRHATGTAYLSGSVSVVGGGGDIQMNSVTFGGGDTVSVSALTYTAGP